MLSPKQPGLKISVVNLRSSLKSWLQNCNALAFTEGCNIKGTVRVDSSRHYDVMSKPYQESKVGIAGVLEAVFTFNSSPTPLQDLIKLIKVESGNGTKTYAFLLKYRTKYHSLLTQSEKHIQLTFSVDMVGKKWLEQIQVIASLTTSYDF